MRDSKDLALFSWPVRSLDPSVWDFSCVGYVKDKACVALLSENMDDVKDQITAAMNTMDYDMLGRIWEEFSHWLDVVRAAFRVMILAYFFETPGILVEK